MILHNGSGVFQYYLKVVPTTYVFASGRNLTSCQCAAQQGTSAEDAAKTRPDGPPRYSVTEQFKSAHDPRNGFVLPGALFAPADACREERLLSPPPL